jgi:SAM-dependent methyltransferase
MKLVQSLKKWLEKPVRFDYIGKFMKPGTRLLDVGCGGVAPYSTFTYYPGVIFSGIDWNDIAGRKDMEYFLQGNLEGNDLIELPDNHYDVINLSHIIEHITDGNRLISALVKKLKPGGIIYIETPSERSLKLPSMYGTLNFWDDPTHQHVYSLKDMSNILTQNGCSIIKAKIRHNLKRILLMPLYIISTLIRDKKINATAIWDITGFAHYIIAKKNS